MIAKKHLLKLLPLFLVPSILSCSHFSPKVIETPSFKKWASSNDVPKVIAILPFTNETEVEGIDKLARESFYEYFSVRPFHDVEIEETDEIIRMLENAEEKEFHKIPPKKLGEFLRCDALVYGKVKRYKKIYLLIYAQTLIEAEIKIVKAQSGKELWKHTLTKRFHEGGVPTSPFGVIPAAIRTTYSLRKSKRNRDIDAFCKKFVSHIPEIQHMKTRSSEGFYDLQLASFNLKEGALHVSSKLFQHGYKPFLREFHSNDEIWHRVMVGPFTPRREALGYKAKLKREFSFLNPIVVRRENSDNISIKSRTVEFCDLQVASFKLEEGALYISSKLSQHGYKPFLTETNNNGELWYRVMLGPYASREEAVRYHVKLKNEFSFLNPTVVKSENRPKDDG